MGSLVNQAQEAYNTYKATNPTDIAGWDNLTDVEVATLFRNDQKYKQAIIDAQSIEESFYAARTEAFATLESEQVAARSALQQSWQTKEDNDFDVDFEA